MYGKNIHSYKSLSYSCFSFSFSFSIRNKNTENDDKEEEEGIKKRHIFIGSIIECLRFCVVLHSKHQNKTKIICFSPHRPLQLTLTSLTVVCHCRLYLYLSFTFILLLLLLLILKRLPSFYFASFFFFCFSFFVHVFYTILYVKYAVHFLFRFIIFFSSSV